jgi:hypothetical protein
MNEQSIGVQPAHVTRNPGIFGQNVGEVQQRPEVISFWASSPTQPTTSQQLPPRAMETRMSTHPLHSGPGRDSQNYFTSFYMPPTAAPTETDPLGSERVRIAERKEIQRRQIEKNNDEPKEVLGQADPSGPSPVEARNVYVERLRPQFSCQAQAPKQAPLTIGEPSTCYYWDKHQKDSRQPPCHMRMTCRSLHRHVQGVPIAPVPNSGSQSKDTQAIDAGKARAAAKVHDTQRNPPFINLPPLLNYPLGDERHIDETLMKAREMPLQRPSGPSPLGSSQRSKAELKVPQVSLPLRPKTSPSPFSSHPEVNMMRDIPPGKLSKSYFNTLCNNPFDTWSPSVQLLQPPSFTQVSPFSHSGSFMSEDSKEIQQMRERIYSNIQSGLRRDEMRKIAEQRALQQEQEFLRQTWGGVQEYKAPEKRTRPGELGFCIEPYYPPIPFKVWSAQEQAKKMEQELRREEERGEKGINQRARAAATEHMAPKSQDNSKVDRKNARPPVLTSKPEMLGEDEPKFAYVRGRKVELREPAKGSIFLCNSRGGTCKEPLTDVHGNPVSWPFTQKPVLDNLTPKSTLDDKTNAKLRKEQKMKLGESQTTSCPAPAQKSELLEQKKEPFGTSQLRDLILELINQEPGSDGFRRGLEQMTARREPFRMKSVSGKAKTGHVKHKLVSDKPTPYRRVASVMDDLLGKPMSMEEEMQEELDDISAALAAKPRKHSVADSKVPTSSFKTALLTQSETKQSAAAVESRFADNGGEFEEVNFKDEEMDTLKKIEEDEDWIVV